MLPAAHLGRLGWTHRGWEPWSLAAEHPWAHTSPPCSGQSCREGQTEARGGFSMSKGGEVQCKQQADQFCVAFKVLSHLRNKHKGQNH